MSLIEIIIRSPTNQNLAHTDWFCAHCVPTNYNQLITIYVSLYLNSVFLITYSYNDMMI